MLRALQISRSQLIAALIIQEGTTEPPCGGRSRHINGCSSNLSGLLGLALSSQEPCCPLAPLGRELGGLALLQQELDRRSLLAHGLALLSLHIER